jgi:hypothetical protein
MENGRTLLKGLIILCILSGSELGAVRPNQARQPRTTKRVEPPMHNITPEKVNGLIRKFLVDSYCLGDKFFRLKSMKILAGVLPFYLIGRKVDPTVHRQFYDADNHRNIHQPPKWLRDILADEAMAIPFGIYGAVGWFNKDKNKRREAQIFTVGLFWTWSSKVLLKQIKADAGLRPWHEEHDRHKRSHGGSPSGHTSMASFMATYLWLAKGPKYGVPLSIYAGMIGGISIAANHHYVSQVVAGAGLGVMVGVAGYAVLQDLQVPENLEIGLATDRRGGLGVRVAYSF